MMFLNVFLIQIIGLRRTSLLFFSRTFLCPSIAITYLNNFHLVFHLSFRWSFHSSAMKRQHRHRKLIHLTKSQLWLNRSNLIRFTFPDHTISYSSSHQLNTSCSFSVYLFIYRESFRFYISSKVWLIVKRYFYFIRLHYLGCYLDSHQWKLKVRKRLVLLLLSYQTYFIKTATCNLRQLPSVYRCTTTLPSGWTMFTLL